MPEKRVKKFEKVIKEFLEEGKVIPDSVSTNWYLKAFFEGRLKICWNPKDNWPLYEVQIPAVENTEIAISLPEDQDFLVVQTNGVAVFPLKDVKRVFFDKGTWVHISDVKDIAAKLAKHEAEERKRRGLGTSA